MSLPPLKCWARCFPDANEITEVKFLPLVLQMPCGTKHPSPSWVLGSSRAQNTVPEPTAAREHESLCNCVSKVKTGPGPARRRPTPTSFLAAAALGLSLHAPPLLPEAATSVLPGKSAKPRASQPCRPAGTLSPPPRERNSVRTEKLRRPQLQPRAQAPAPTRGRDEGSRPGTSPRSGIRGRYSRSPGFRRARGVPARSAAPANASSGRWLRPGSPPWRQAWVAERCRRPRLTPPSAANAATARS